MRRALLVCLVIVTPSCYHEHSARDESREAWQILTRLREGARAALKREGRYVALNELGMQERNGLFDLSVSAVQNHYEVRLSARSGFLLSFYSDESQTLRWAPYKRGPVGPTSEVANDELLNDADPALVVFRIDRNLQGLSRVSLIWRSQYRVYL